MGFFGDIERFLAELYAYRWPVAIGAFVVLTAVAAWGSRKGWHLAVWRRRRAVAVIGTPLLILAIAGGWFTVSPLFQRTQLEEANPLVSLTGMPGNIQMMDEQLISDIPPASLPTEPIDSITKDTTEKAGNAADQNSMVAAGTMLMPTGPSTDSATGKVGDANAASSVREETDSTRANIVPTNGDTIPTDSVPTDAISMDAASPDVTPTDADKTPTDKTPADVTPVFTPGITHNGEFRGTDEFHFARGQASLIETSPGQYVLRFEDFSVRNGPGLYVYLSPDADRYTGDSLQLGKLKATDGSFNYEIPAGTDVSVQERGHLGQALRCSIRCGPTDCPVMVEIIHLHQRGKSGNRRMTHKQPAEGGIALTSSSTGLVLERE